MKRLVILTVILLLGLLPATAREYAVSGPEGGLAIKVALPDGFDPGSVIKQACQGGKFFNARFDPADPPAFIRCWGTMKLGREYLLTTQQLDIYGTAASYQGPVLLLHGTKDSIVSMWCSEKYLETYGTRASLVKVDGENHLITRRKKEILARTVAFFREVFD